MRRLQIGRRPGEIDAVPQTSVFTPMTSTMAMTTIHVMSTVGGIEHGGVRGQPAQVRVGVAGVHQHQIPGGLFGALVARSAAPCGVSK